MTRRRAGASVVVAAALAACGPKVPPSGVTRGEAVVYVTSNVGDAQIYVDGRFVGPVDVLRGGIAMDAGTHRVEVRRDDYFSRYVELELHRAQRARLRLDLAPVLP